MVRTFLKVGIVILLAGFAVSCASTVEREQEKARRQRLIETHIQLGVGYYQAGSLEVARDNFKKVLELDPDNTHVHNMLALMEFKLKNYDQAEKHFRKALQAAQDDPELWNNYGVFLCERGRFEEAVEWFKKALSHAQYRYPEQANLNAGLCLMKKPAPRVAEEYFRVALEINPSLSQALYQMAKISYESGRTLSASGFMQRYFEFAKETAETLLLAVKIEEAMGNKDAEASYALRLRSKFPDSAEAKELKHYPIGPRTKGR